MPLLPDKNGKFHCLDCEYETEDIFDLFNHQQTEFSWTVSIGGSRSVINLIDFFESLSDYIRDGHAETARDQIQALVTTFVNVFDGQSTKGSLIFNETVIRRSADTFIKNIEEMLKDATHGE